MSRKEVLVQLDDELVDALDRVAAERGMNRSELIRSIATAFLAALDESSADVDLVAAYTEHPQDPAEVETLARAAIEIWPDY